MAYTADPGRIFDSDAHRRTLAHLNKDTAFTLEDLYVRMQPDVGTDYAGEDELDEVLQDLEADGYATKSSSGWKMTKKGLDALNAPLPDDG